MRVNTCASRLTMVSLGLLWALAAWPLRAQEDNEMILYPAHPRVGFGDIRSHVAESRSVEIGASQAAARNSMGKPAGSYSLPGGVQANYWTDEDGAVRTFYRDGVIVQVSDSDTNLPKPMPGNITFTSTIAQVRQAYPGVRLHEYHANGGGGGGVTDYYDDERRGIAFEFTRSGDGGAEKPRMYAVIIHKAGMPVIPDVGER